MLESFLEALPASKRGPAAQSIRAGGSWCAEFFDWIRVSAEVVHASPGFEVLEDSAGMFHVSLFRAFAFDLTPNDMVATFGGCPTDGQKAARAFGEAIRAAAAILDGEDPAMDRSEARALLARLLQ